MEPVGRQYGVLSGLSLSRFASGCRGLPEPKESSRTERSNVLRRVLVRRECGYLIQQYYTWCSRMTGVTWEELCAKYEAQVLAEEPGVVPDELKQRVYFRILEKSCCTSEMFDNLVGLNRDDPDGSGGDDTKGNTAASTSSTSSLNPDGAEESDGVSISLSEDPFEASLAECSSSSSRNPRVRKLTLRMLLSSGGRLTKSRCLRRRSKVPRIRARPPGGRSHVRN